MRTERMTEALGLDETQARTVYDQCLREAQLQRQLSEVRQENAANMKRILNEKQYAEWQRMHAVGAACTTARGRKDRPAQLAARDPALRRKRRVPQTAARRPAGRPKPVAWVPDPGKGVGHTG